MKIKMFLVLSLIGQMAFAGLIVPSNISSPISSSDISTGAVTSIKILDATIISADISLSAGIVSSQILNGTLVSGDISATAGIPFSYLDYANVNKGLIFDSLIVDGYGSIGTEASSDSTIGMSLFTGDSADGSTGDFEAYSGDAQVTSGGVYLFTGISDVGATGPLDLATGEATLGNSGTIDIYSGDAPGNNSGSISITTGQADIASGTIFLTAGAAGGTRGVIDLDAREVRMNSTKIVSLADPGSAQDAATKTYVDNVVIASANITDGTITSADLSATAIPIVKGGTGSTAPYWISAQLAGANIDLGVAAVTAYTEMTNAGLTLTPRSGSAAAGTMCSTTNAATAPSTSATICAAGSESLGIAFTIPDASAAYEVCAYFSHYASMDTAENLSTAFQLIETPTDAQTLTLEGGSIGFTSTSTTQIATGADATTVYPIANCSIFKWASVGTKGIRLMYEQSIIGTPDVSTIYADASATNGQRAINFTVKKVY